MNINLFKKTKIVCTIGPASDSLEMLKKLVNAGMNVARLNFSHGSYEEHLAKIEKIRSLEKEGIYIAIMLDTKGPEIRCHNMENDAVEIKKGSSVRVSMKEVLGTPKKFSVNFPGLINDVNLGNHIKIDDGKLDLLIESIDYEKGEIVCTALNEHLLCSKKGVNCTGARLSMPFISDKDKQDLIWGCKHGVDFISASFVRNEKDVKDIRNILIEQHSENIKIISKIENYEALSLIEDIVDASDGIMVARGDLGVEIPAEEVPLIQKKLIALCRKAGKPVITATQMLDSMCHSPVPTRAEVSDVATAISESSDCVMLSAESASGEYPVEAVETQAKISHVMEQDLNYEKLAQEAYDTSNKDNNDAIANSIANTAKLINAKLIVNFTETGRSSRRISKARPICPVLAISNNIETVRQNSLYWGINSIYIPTKMPDFIEEMEVLAIIYAKDFGLTSKDVVVLASGTPTGAGKTNFMKIITLPEDKGL
ncbi:MAG: pyruvate kinase [Bacilli bacterium]